MTGILVADIGGTNARFAIAEGARLLARKIVPTAAIRSLPEALSAYLHEAGDVQPERAVLAVAAPFEGDAVSMTNAELRFSAAEVKSALHLARLDVVNDFKAMARGASQSTRLSKVKGGNALPGAPRIVLGPGTGLGLALVFGEAAAPQIVATQGGHAAFAPQTALEQKVWTALHDEFSFVSFENVLSGPGLSRIHRIVAGRREDPEQVTAAANAGDPLALATFSVFFAALATFAADAALMAGAQGGVILAGGILPRVDAALVKSDFARRFAARPAMKNYLEAIPVHLLLDPDAALVGAALLAGGERQ